jgi:hypothetical protein
MTKAIAISLSIAAALALCGCAGMQNGGQNLSGFPIDEGCMNFHANDPMYGGNRALAYATDCAKSNM